MVGRLVLLGGGGHCRSCIDVIQSTAHLEIEGIIEKAGAQAESILGYAVIGFDESVEEFVAAERAFLVTIGQIKDPRPRVRLFERLQALGATLATVEAASARVSRHAQVGPGTIVMHNALVNAGAQVGANCIVNTGAIVEHDVNIADHVHISTACVVNGGASVGRGSFVGSNAVVREGVRIGEGVVIAAGSVIMRDVPHGSIVRPQQ